MATKTNKLGLSKAELTDAVRSTLTANNGNFDIIDDQITRLKANQPKGTASGTEIVVEDSAEMESNLHISGNSEQEVRSGKNLLKKDSNYVTTTNNGITFTVNKDESVTLNGTNNNSNNSVIFLWQNDNNPIHFSAGTYNTSKTGYNAIVIIGYTGSEYIRFMGNDINSFTFDKDVDFQRIYIQVAKGSTVAFDNVTLYPIMTKSTDSVEPYEPYGATPSPEFPSEIRSVKSKSDNLLPNEVTSQTVNGVTLTLNEDKSFVLNGTATAKAVFILASGTEDPLDVGTYMISLGEKGQTGVALGAKLDASDGTTKYIFTGSNTKWDLDKAYTLTRSYLDVESGTTLNKFVVKPMLRKGDKLLPYQPYGYIPVEANVEGNNIAKINEKDWALVDNAIESKARNSGATLATFNIKKGQTIIAKLKMLSSHSQDTSFTGYVNGVVENNLGFFRIDTAVVGNIATRTYTATEDCEIKWMCWGNANSEKMKFQLWATLDSNPLEDYEPYLEPNIVSIPLGDIELRSTPDGTRDTFERVDGVWNKVGNIESTIFDGNEVWEYAFGCFRIKWNCKGTTNQQNLEHIVMSDKYKVETQYAIQSENSTIDYGIAPRQEGANGFVIRNKDITTLEYWKTWLSSNPTQVDYVLATPTYTPITDTALIQALDTLEQLILHKGYNRITVTSVNGVKAYLDLSYIKDINTVLNNIITKLGGV